MLLAMTFASPGFRIAQAALARKSLLLAGNVI